VPDKGGGVAAARSASQDHHRLAGPDAALRLGQQQPFVRELEERVGEPAGRGVANGRDRRAGQRAADGPAPRGMLRTLPGLVVRVGAGQGARRAAQAVGQQAHRLLQAPLPKASTTVPA
jgi:hypothetical protein